MALPYVPSTAWFLRSLRLRDACDGAESNGFDSGGGGGRVGFIYNCVFLRISCCASGRYGRHEHVVHQLSEQTLAIFANVVKEGRSQQEIDTFATFLLRAFAYLIRVMLPLGVRFQDRMNELRMRGSAAAV